jgi:hypothetical protein
MIGISLDRDDCHFDWTTPYSVLGKARLRLFSSISYIGIRVYIAFENCKMKYFTVSVTRGVAIPRPTRDGGLRGWLRTSWWD